MLLLYPHCAQTKLIPSQQTDSIYLTAWVDYLPDEMLHFSYFPKKRYDIPGKPKNVFPATIVLGRWNII